MRQKSLMAMVGAIKRVDNECDRDPSPNRDETNSVGWVERKSMRNHARRKEAFDVSFFPKKPKLK